MEVGQKIYFKRLGNAARYSDEIIEATITKVGRKYFNVEAKGVYMGNSRFHVDTLMHDGGRYSPDYKGYLSRQDIEDEMEAGKLYMEIKRSFDHFSRPSLSLKKLRAIKKIIEDEGQ